VAEAKIELKVGAVSFMGEGESNWVSGQLDKFLGKIGELTKIAPQEPSDGKDKTPKNPKSATGTLASFLKVKGASSNQIRRFLATATWLHDRENKDRLNTRDISKALSANSQPKLTNPADCLNKNVAKGCCEKDGNDFFVTPEGRAEIG